MRIVPGEPEKSAVWLRMTQRGTRAQMPPLGTLQVDAAGVAQVRAFVAGLSEREPGR